ncbi:hypothetical protein PPACK8108_LOCUS6298 [Phakopsora pachyrhizi]|uniref:Uncharacterized protein n=1 Tax=Phakopsora pachyrhizi TaxID=170000 RepID=A0AAV0AR28_PHAPC|nr:hypothetical protein PPACK8108_LOCUS6298 [Phakopsora pachyrhizi]
MDFYSTEDFSRIIFRASKLTTVIVRFNQSRSRKNLDDDDCLDFYEEHHNSNCGNSINKDYLGWNTVIKSELKTLVEDPSIPTKTNIDYDRDGSAIDDEGSKEIIQEFDFESCEIPDGSAAAPAIDSAYPRWMEIILLQDKVKQKQLDFKNVVKNKQRDKLRVRVSEVRLLRNILVEDLSIEREGDESQLKRRWPAGSWEDEG